MSFRKYEKIYNEENDSESDILRKYSRDILNKHSYDCSKQIENSINSNKIYYFIREPLLKKPEKFNKEEYDNYKILDGSSNDMMIKSFCYEGALIVDGSFMKKVDYNEEFYLSIADNKLRTIENI